MLHLLGQFVLVGRAAEPGFERLHRLVELAGLGADQPRHPVHGPQFVEHGAADARHAVGLELHAARQVEGVDGVHQAEDAGRDQVVQLDAFGQPRPDPLAVVLHQRQVDLDQPVAQVLVVGVALELDPQLFNVFRSDSGGHDILRDGALAAPFQFRFLVGLAGLPRGPGLRGLLLFQFGQDAAADRIADDAFGQPADHRAYDRKGQKTKPRRP